ncbi:hypothetical protein BGZ73_002448 [Actinomortierella ambigua]|nr:hypothetical protein BGZ73_002448 [Actinomortierella ambigua]
MHGGVLMPKQPLKNKGGKKGRVPYFVGHLFDEIQQPLPHHPPHTHSLQQGLPPPQGDDGSAATTDEGLQRASYGEGSTPSTTHEPGSSSNTESLLAQTTMTLSAMDDVDDGVESVQVSNQVAACHRPSVAIENSECDYDAVEAINQDLTRQLKQIVSQKFFKFYKLNLYGTCPFWTEDHYCTNEDCSVALIDEKHIPEEWRSRALGAISSPRGGMLFQPFKSCNFKDQDFCQVDDEANGEGVYVDLMKNPERFTGYSGPSAAKVWDAIYDENCFNVAHRMQMAADCEQCQLDREAAEAAAAAAAVEKQEQATKQHQQGMLSNSGSGMSLAAAKPMRGAPGMAKVFGKTGPPAAAAAAAAAAAPRHFMRRPSSQDEEDVCLEKRVFYRMISGLHASISIHICDEYFNQTTGVWGPNLECFVNRVGAHPDRMENLFFDYSMLLRAVSKMSRYLKDYSFCTGNAEEDMQVKGMVDKFIETAQRTPTSFDEKAMFVGPDAQQLKTEFRDHYRNITRIMDCVGCEKCRLWGKVQTSGLATALKVLFSYNDEFFFSSSPVNHPDLLQRTEIVALFNTLNRFSESIESITRFRKLYLEQYGYAEPAYWTHTPPTVSTESASELAEDRNSDENKEVEDALAVLRENAQSDDDAEPPKPADAEEKDEKDKETEEPVENVYAPLDFFTLDTAVEAVSLEALVLDNDSQQAVMGDASVADGAEVEVLDDGKDSAEVVSSFMTQFLQRIGQPVEGSSSSSSSDGHVSGGGDVPIKVATSTVAQKREHESVMQQGAGGGGKAWALRASEVAVEIREKVVLRWYYARSWLLTLFENRYNRVA